MIVELRQYTLEPGRRDVLVDLFERYFIESQEALGITVIGQFYDLDDPDRFVWLRGFENMVTRKAGLTRFYGESEAWRTHGPAANATMIDWTDVLLLRPLDGALPMQPRPPIGAEAPSTTYAVTISPERVAVADPLACFETAPVENDYPRLPVRTDTAFVAFQRLDPTLGGYTLRLKPTPRSAVR
jgi:hypothetical protein